MESGMVIATSPVRLEKPSSVLSPLSDLTPHLVSSHVQLSKEHGQQPSISILQISGKSLEFLFMLLSPKGGAGLSNMLMFTHTGPSRRHSVATMQGAMSEHELLHEQWRRKVGRGYSTFPATVEKKTEPDYVNLSYAPDGSQVADQQPPPSNTPPGGSIHGILYQSVQIPPEPQITREAMFQAERQPETANHQKLYASIPHQQSHWPGLMHQQHSHHEESALPSSGGGWEGPRAKNPTLYQNFPNQLSTGSPDLTTSQSYPLTTSPDQPSTSSLDLTSQSYPPTTTSHTAGWDGPRADNPTTFQNIPNQPFTPGPRSSDTTASQSYPPTTTSHAASPQPDPAVIPDIEVSPYSSQGSLIRSLAPPIINFPPESRPRSDSAGGSFPSDSESKQLGDSQSAQYEASNPTSRQTSLSSENSSNVDIYGSGSNLLSVPAKSHQSLENPSVTTSRKTSFSSETGSSVDIYGSGPNLLTVPARSHLSLPDQDNPPVTTSLRTSFSSEKSSSVDIYGSGPNLLIVQTKSHLSLPDQDNPPVTSLSSEKSSSVDLCGSDAYLPGMGSQPLPVQDVGDEGSSVDTHGSDPTLPTKEELSFPQLPEAKAAVSKQELSKLQIEHNTVSLKMPVYSPLQKNSQSYEELTS